MTSQPSPPESELLRDCRDGVPGAFARLYDQHKDRAFGLALRMLGQRELAEDVTQRAFVRVHRHLDRFRGDSRFSTWLHRVVVNLCLDERGKKAWTHHVQLDDAAPERLVAPDATDRDALTADRRDVLEDAMADLPPEIRDAVWMKYIGGLTYEEIAEAQGTTKGTVGSRIHRGLRSLRRILERRGSHV